MKENTKKSIQLTPDELASVVYILRQAIRAMKYDEGIELFIDGGNFIASMERGAFLTLIDAQMKLSKSM